jgi:cell division protein FtsZ
MQATRPLQQSQSAPPKGLRIERPRSEQGPAALPKRVELQPRALAAEMSELATESPADDDLEIPAFLRRRAN